MMFRDRSAAYQVLGVVLILGLLTVTPFSGVTFADELTGIRLLEEIQNVFITLADRVKPAVVNISPVSVSTKSSESPRERGQNNPGTGSGVIVDKDGIVVTNNHVVGDAKEVEVRLSDKSKYVGQVIGRDPDTDLAVAKLTADRALPTVPFGDSSKVRVGQWVMAVGNPFSLDRTVTVGVVSGLERDAVRLSRYEAFIQTDASINPGNSGGPLFNIQGEGHPRLAGHRHPGGHSGAGHQVRHQGIRRRPGERRLRERARRTRRSEAGRHHREGGRAPRGDALRPVP